MNEVVALFQEYLPLLQAQKGPALLALMVMFAIRLFRLDFFQGFLPEKAKFSAWPSLAKFALPAALAAGGALLTGLTGGLVGLPLLLAIGKAALGAVLANHATKAVGSALGGEVSPSYPRLAVSPIFPLPKSKLPVFTLVK